MSKWTLAKHRLSHRDALRVLQAAMKEAESLSVAQNIAIADDGGNLLAVRMNDTKLLSKENVISKAMISASHRQATIQLKLAVAAGGRLTNLNSQPLIVAGYCVGGIGVGSGTGQQDIAVTKAGAAALTSEESEL